MSSIELFRKIDSKIQFKNILIFYGIDCNSSSTKFLKFFVISMKLKNIFLFIFDLYFNIVNFTQNKSDNWKIMRDVGAVMINTLILMSHLFFWRKENQFKRLVNDCKAFSQSSARVKKLEKKMAYIWIAIVFFDLFVSEKIYYEELSDLFINSIWPFYSTGWKLAITLIHIECCNCIYIREKLILNSDENDRGYLLQDYLVMSTFLKQYNNLEI